MMQASLNMNSHSDTFDFAVNMKRHFIHWTELWNY